MSEIHSGGATHGTAIEALESAIESHRAGELNEWELHVIKGRMEQGAAARSEKLTPTDTAMNAAYNGWWEPLTLKGDPMRRPNLSREAFAAGVKWGREMYPEDKASPSAIAARDCVWTKDSDGCYTTACQPESGASLVYDGPLDECGVTFCQRCGGKVREV